MKRPVLFLIILLASYFGQKAAAQIGIKVMQFRPTGNLGLVVDRKIVPELLYIDDFEEVVRFRAAIATFKLEPRMAAFPITGAIYDSDGFRVVAGTEVYTKFNMSYLSGGMDFRIVRLFDDALSIYPGLDIIGGFVNMEHTAIVPGVAESSFSGGSFMAGLRPRGGIDYAITESIGVFAEFSVAFYALEEVGKVSHHDLGFGARYIF